MMTPRMPNLNLTLGHHASGGERALVAALGEGGREASFTSHVPGMRATGKSQVAVKTIPWPNK